jgi:phenylacetate-CoA ligase
LIGGVRGRADEMLVIRGVNLFPSAVEDVLRKIPGVGGEYQLVLDETLKDAAGFPTAIRLRIESEPGAPDTLGEQVAHRIREALTVRAVVEVSALGTLPRSVHKAKRVIWI